MDRFNLKLLMIGGSIIGTVGCLVAAFSSHFYVLLVAFGVLGGTISHLHVCMCIDSLKIV
mgnify:CR=1 FL=1